MGTEIPSALPNELVLGPVHARFAAISPLKRPRCARRFSRCWTGRGTALCFAMSPLCSTTAADASCGPACACGGAGPGRPGPAADPAAPASRGRSRPRRPARPGASRRAQGREATPVHRRSRRTGVRAVRVGAGSRRPRQSRRCRASARTRRWPGPCSARSPCRRIQRGEHLHLRPAARAGDRAGAAGGGPAVGCMANDTAPGEALPTLRPYGRSAEITPNRPGEGPMDHPRVRSGRP
jgi:hypothetical protein